MITPTKAEHKSPQKTPPSSDASSSSPGGSSTRGKDKLTQSRRSLADLTLSASGRASFKQSRTHRHLFLSSSSQSANGADEDDAMFSTMAWTWGSGKYGRLGLATTADASVPAPVAPLAEHSVHQISCGAYVTAFIVDDGQLWMSGKDIDNLFAGTQENLQKLNEDYLSPIQLTAFFGKIAITSVSVGETICAAVSEFGDLFWWGRQFGTNVRSQPAGRVSAKVCHVSCGAAHAVALTVDGAALSWGENGARQLGHSSVGEFVAEPTAVRAPNNSRVKTVACGYSSTALQTHEGDVYAFGSIVGQKDVQLVSAFQPVKPEHISQLFCHDLYLAVVTLHGSAYVWHSGSVPFLDPKSDPLVKVFPEVSVRSLVCGADFMSCVTDAGAVYSWGRCSLMLGLGEVRAKKHLVGPKMLGSFSARFVRSISGGASHMAAVAMPIGGQRESIAWELLETERIYLRSLVILTTLYKPLAKPRSLLGKLFTEIDAMLKFHTEFLSDLEAKMERWADSTVLGPLFLKLSHRRHIEMYLRFHRLHLDWTKSAGGSHLPGGKKFAQYEALDAQVMALRKTESADERKKPNHLVGLMTEPFDRIRRYFWGCTRLRQVTPEWHPDVKDLNEALESFQRELSVYHSETEMLKMTVSRLETDKEELLKKLAVLSATNDSLFLSRNNHEMQKRELTDLTEQYEHKIKTITRESEQLRERMLQLFLEKRRDNIRKRRAEATTAKLTEENAVLMSESKRIERELSAARSTKLFRDVTELREAVSSRDREILELKQQLQKTREAQVMQTYTDQHVAGLQKENDRLSKALEETLERLRSSIALRDTPIEVIDEFEGKQNGVSFASDGSVRGATVKGLVQLLVQLDGKESVSSYLKTFFLTYRMFITPTELCYALQELYCKVPRNMEPPVQWSRVLGVVRFWITQHAHDFVTVPGLKALLWGFLEETVCVTLSPNTADAIMKDFTRQNTINERVLREQEETRTQLASKAETIAASLACDIDLTFVSECSPADCATQLVLVEHQLLCCIEARELLGQGWMKSDSAVRSPGVVAFTTRFNFVSSWVVSEVLARSDVKERRDVISYFIQVATRARAIGAFNTVMEVVGGLNCGPVQRLKKTWETLGRRERTAFEELEELLAPSGSFKNLREAVKEQSRKGLACLPYVGIYLGDLVYTDEGSMPELSPGVVNFAKLAQISNIIEGILQFREPKFEGAVVQKVRNYLVHCKVLGEEEAWNVSYEREPKN